MSVNELRKWRSIVKQCRKCRLLSDGREIDPSDDNQYRHAQIHYETNQKNYNYRLGWATAMLDKTPEPDCTESVLADSCKSGILAVLEAPNRDDTYDPNKGYLTFDKETDETGNFTRHLLKNINIATTNVAFTNAVQCMPPDRGHGPKITTQQRINCRGHLLRLIAILRPRVVLAFGNAAMQELHRFEPIYDKGRKLRLDEVNVGNLVGRGYPWASTCLVPLYHPGPIVIATALRKDGSAGSGRTKEDQLQDIKVVARILRIGHCRDF